MTINELLDKPVWQMTGGELLFLAQHGNISTSMESTKASSSKEEKRYVYGWLALHGSSAVVCLQLTVSSRVVKSIVPLHKSVVRLLLMPTLRWNWQGERQEDDDEYN